MTIRQIGLVLICASACGTVTVADPIDSGAVDQTPVNADSDAQSAESIPRPDAVAVPEVGAGDAGPTALPACPHQTGPLSYSSPCTPTCAADCRDQLAVSQVNCQTREGVNCVDSCGGCP